MALVLLPTVLVVLTCCFAALPVEDDLLPFFVLYLCASLEGLPFSFFGSTKQGITTSSKSSTYEKSKPENKQSAYVDL